MFHEQPVPEIPRHKTAIVRVGYSKPVSLAISHQVIRPGRSVFDFGCGRGTDVARLAKEGYSTAGWDPNFKPDAPRIPADVVNLGYVINVIEDAGERRGVLEAAYKLAKSCLVVSAQISYLASPDAGQAYADGILTRRGTFQKYYSQEELRKFIEEVLGVEPVPAALGVFYVFRDEGERQSFLLSQVSRRVSREPRTRVPLEESLAPFRELLEAFSAQVDLLGRVPRESEFPGLPELNEKVGSTSRCLKLCEKLFGSFSFSEARRLRSEDLLVYIALSRFGRRPRFSDLPEALQWDIRDIFGTYARACDQGDELLFRVGKPDVVNQACMASKLGKLLPDDLYVHLSAVDRLDSVLRVYVGCARAVLGEVEDANIVKIHRHTGKVSYLAYPKFEKDPHPALAKAVKINLRTREVWVRDYSASDNPPILHRKETFVPPEHPLRPKFEELTRKEEAAGLLDTTQPIGFLKGWTEVLAEKGYQLRGHRLQRAKPKGADGSKRG
ncbi:MAG TPA: DNA phosphorothioation-associated putative methyltransferase [Planctomycetota bacterium]|nr:DNA phosphorothioation-associated putative methyltransferase [Planctomycetota bacterium]